MHLKCETLFIAINLLDRYLSFFNQELNLKLFQIIALTCLFISSKYEEIYPPPLKDFISKRKIKKDDILLTEGDIMQVIGFSMSLPTSLSFLQGFLKYD